MPENRVQAEYGDEKEHERDGRQTSCGGVGTEENVLHQQAVADLVQEGADDAENGDGGYYEPRAETI